MKVRIDAIVTAKAIPIAFAMAIAIGEWGRVWQKKAIVESKNEGHARLGRQLRTKTKAQDEEGRKDRR